MAVDDEANRLAAAAFVDMPADPAPASVLEDEVEELAPPDVVDTNAQTPAVSVDLPLIAPSGGFEAASL